MERQQVVTREEWLVARRELLAREKELTRALDGLNADRRRLPIVRVDKDYRFTGPDGEVGLLDLFDGRHQLVLQHFMFDPSWDRGCGSCSAMADDLSEGARAHLAARDTAFAAVSRAPYPRLNAYRRARGWTFPWYSSYGSDFNYDFHVTMDESVAPVEYNYRGAAEHAQAGTTMFVEAEQPFEMPGTSYCATETGSPTPTRTSPAAPR